MFDLELRLARPKGPDNPFCYYPEVYHQDQSKSIVDENHKYDLTRFSEHESEIIYQAINVAKNKYPRNLMALGLVNEAYEIIYKPRYVLFEIAVIMYSGSTSPEEQIAAAFSYSQKGAMYRENAISLYEKSINRVNFKTLDLFSSLSSVSTYLNLAELYEREHKYHDALFWFQKALYRGGLNDSYIKGKMQSIRDKADSIPRKKRSLSKDSINFETNVHNAALYFIGKAGLSH